LHVDLIASRASDKSLPVSKKEEQEEEAREYECSNVEERT
jgi:hypothetical protein|tara:strand:+ start:4018 stop:4137 length:120 start_codon:yes stop_codon:yes gene_type:complete